MSGGKVLGSDTIVDLEKNFWTVEHVGKMVYLKEWREHQVVGSEKAELLLESGSQSLERERKMWIGLAIIPMRHSDDLAFMLNKNPYSLYFPIMAC